MDLDGTMKALVGKYLSIYQPTEQYADDVGEDNTAQHVPTNLEAFKPTHTSKDKFRHTRENDPNVLMSA